MYPTRRLWADISLAVFLSVLAVVIAHPLPLAGAGLIGAWVLTQQYRFVRELEATMDGLSVQQTPAKTSVRTQETVPVTLAASLDGESALDLELDAELPTATVSDRPLTLSLEAGAVAADRTVEVSWPVAGHHRFGEVAVTASNGYAREVLSTGETPTVTVEPQGPRTIHVGEGGNRIVTAYGEHEAGRSGSGLEPAELREYVPGDTADRIDWKATARLATPHVREYEASTNRRTHLFVDHRATLATGREGERKHDYLREVALATAASAHQLGDPIGLVTVGDGGVTSRFEPATTPEAYKLIRKHILELEPTSGHDTERGAEFPLETATVSADGSGPEHSPLPRQGRGPLTAAAATEKFASISGDTDRFAETLRPFYADRQRYHERINSDPLYGAVRTTHNRSIDTIWTVIFTDDSRPTELRETVKLARRHSNTVMVLLAPTVLYEPGSLADIERAYDRYVEFEALRRDLARIDRVTALEVGPKDRLSTVLSASRPRMRGGRA